MHRKEQKGLRYQLKKILLFFNSSKYDKFINFRPKRIGFYNIVIVKNDKNDSSRASI